MPIIQVRLRDGQEAAFDAAEGYSLMEALRDSSIGDISALCGGCCSCATCHIYVLEGTDLLPPMKEDEDGMLDASLLRRKESRLACQLPVSTAWTGLTIEIAPEE